MKIKYLFCAIACYFAIENALAQQIPTGPAMPSASPLPTKADHAWYRGGNFLTGPPAGTKNIFGTMWNSQIYTVTNGVNRTKLNGTVNYLVNNFAGNRDGYLLLGRDGTSYDTIGDPRDFYGNANFGAFTLLHLSGPNSGQGFGYRPWMQTGITFTGNEDNSYIGQKANGLDQTDMVINWSDNAVPGFGPDVMKFSFTTGAGASSAVGADLIGTSMDGREIMRMMGYGFIGVGPRFNNNFSPQSTYHQHQENEVSSWMQITNQTMTNPGIQSAATAINATNGFRFGILGNVAQVQNGNAFIYNQEKRHIIFSTGYATPTTMGATNERMRITSLENPTTLTSGYGINNPAGLSPTYTRVAISEDPLNPITRPLSLLHIGYNTGLITPSNDGWRPWMDVGMYVSKSSDNVYLGLKAEPGVSGIPGLDRHDAVLNWGDNQISSGIPTSGPDNLRFIFTSSTTSGSGTPPATGLNGLEGGRMTPTLTTGIFTGFGGDPTTNLYTGASINPTQTLEVNSWGATTVAGGSSGLRFTNLNITSPTIANPGDGVLSVNANGDVIYVPDVLNSLGNLCGATPNPLINNYQVPMAGNSIFLHGGSSIQIGDVTPCTSFSPARLYVRNSTGLLPEGLRIETSFPGTIAGHFVWPGAGPGNFAGLFNGDVRINGVAGCTLMAWTSDSMFKTNVNPIKSASEILRKLKPHTYKMDVINFPQFNFDDDLQYGFIAQEVEQVLPELIHESVNPATTDSLGNIVYPSVAFKSLNYNAFIPIAVQAINELGLVIDRSTLSDQSIKTNVQNLSGSLAKVKQMRGVTYEWSSAAQTNMELDSIQHIGFIAQEMNAIEPLLTFVDDSSLMHVNYDRVVPMLVESIKELDATIVSKDSIIALLQNNDSILDARMTALENALNACCNNHSMIQNTTSNSIASQNIELKDDQSVVLDQNSPNPFSEQTTINYFLPDNVVKAQMLFYNVSGKLIQSVDLNERGKGSLNVFAQDLSNGIYTYTLVVDGEIVETKKMVKQQ